jgi:hypothetical protein
MIKIAVALKVDVGDLVMHDLPQELRRPAAK